MCQFNPVEMNKKGRKETLAVIVVAEAADNGNLDENGR